MGIMDRAVEESNALQGALRRALYSRDCRSASFRGRFADDEPSDGFAFLVPYVRAPSFQYEYRTRTSTGTSIRSKRISRGEWGQEGVMGQDEGEKR